MLLFFTELLVRGTALCLLIALALLLMRRVAATYRHLLCTLALCGLLTLPLIQELLPPLPLLEATKPVAIAPPVAPVVISEPIPPAPEPIPQPLPSGQRRGEGAGISRPSMGQVGWRSEERAKPGGFGAFWWVLACWALGAAVLLLRLAVAMVRLRSLAKRSQRTRIMGTEVLVSECVTTPLTWGVRRPVILLPAALLTGDPAVAESALRHEKAHIARRDWLWHLLAEVVCALCWFQPSAWWLRRRLRAESERACDDRVLLSGVSGPDYAAHLLEILKVGRASALAPGMAAVGSMELRVKHILDPKKPRRAHGLRLALTAVLGLVLLPLASLKVAAKPGERPVSRLQAAVELLAPKLAFLTPSALLAQAKATLIAPKPFAKPEGGEPKRAGRLIMPQGSPAAEPPLPGSTISLKDVHWGTAVDGLEPGFLLTGVTLIEDRQGTTKIGYTALVRNKTNQPITFLVRLLQYDGYDVPFTQNNSVESKFPLTERAKGVRHTDLGRDAVNLITLAPGESVLVPGQEAHHNLRVLIGSGDGGKSPYFEKIKEGMGMLVQPLTVYRSADLTQLTRDLARYSVTKFASDGTTRTESSVRVSMPDSGGTTLEAQLWLSKIRDTPATASASELSGRVIALNNVVWEKAVDGLQPGIFLTGPGQVSPSGKISYQVLIRNTTNKPIEFTVQCLPNCESHQRPYLVPDSEMTRIGAGQAIPAQFRTPERTVWMIFSEYVVTLAPQESVQVPGDFTLALGRGGNTYPYIETVQPGKNWLVQPVKVHQITPAERAKYTRLQGKFKLTKIDAVGKVREESEGRIVESGEGKLLFPRAAVEVVSPAPAGEIPPTLGPMIPLERVVWNEAVDGLAAGFLVTTPGHPNHYRVPMNSKLTYQTLVRNTSDKPLSFLTRLLQYDGYETPTVDGKPTKGAKRGYPFDPLYSVTLTPGESVIVPAQNGRYNLEVYVGEGDSGGNPSIAAITPGHLKIVQPIKIYRSPDHGPLSNLMGIYTLSKVSPEGKVSTEGANRATGIGGGTGRIEGGTTLEAYIYLEVGTLNAAAERNASAAGWGKVDRGLQCGIRMLNTTRTFKTGDTLEAELLWRNVGDKKAHWTLPRQLDLWPIITGAGGQHHLIDSGARFRIYPISTDYEPGEVRSLGILKVTLVAEATPSPKSNKEPGHITLAPGNYFFSGSGGVSSEGDPCPHSGEVVFTVVGGAPQATKTVKDEGIAWGKEVGGYRYGLRDGGNLEKLEVWVQNLSSQKQTLRYPIAPPDYRGSFLCYDAAGKETRLPHPGPIQSYGALANLVELAPQGKALLYADPLKPWQEKLQSEQVRSIAWVSADGENKTGRLAFRAPEPTKSEVELSLRLPKGVTTFSKLSEARFEVVLRNRSDKPLTASWMNPANFSFYGPDLFTKDGEPIPYVHTVGGPYKRQGRQLASGESVVLGTIQIPSEVQEKWNARPQGPYLASGPPPPSPYEARFSLTITVPGKGEQQLSTRLPFMVKRR
ncbi:M56 family metallopeptidase [Armatimonas sp.]|uniref:M56 family metallopeptidase n=1 Tax=Armatimonas sp. TaxID=1872638 RepID=UPI00286D3774|nr:M56 family metallopeptidase [Armatimonas sp.]